MHHDSMRAMSSSVFLLRIGPVKRQLTPIRLGSMPGADDVRIGGDPKRFMPNETEKNVRELKTINFLNMEHLAGY